MNEFLIIRLTNQPSDLINWLVWSASSQQVIASGEIELSNLASLQSYRQPEQGQIRPVVGLIPSNQVLLTNITIPKGAARQLDNMLPFLMEDELAQDIDDMHFTVLSKQSEQATVATIERQYLQQWIDELTQAGLALSRALPDCLALPKNDGGVSALRIDDQWLLRQGEVKGAAVDQDWLELFLSSGWLAPDGDALRFEDVVSEDSESSAESDANTDMSSELEQFSDEAQPELPTSEQMEQQLAEQQQALQHKQQLSERVHIYCYSDLPDKVEQLAGHWQSSFQDALPMAVLAQGAMANKINLLTGPFKVQSTWFKQWRVWQKVAIAAVVLCAVLVTQQVLKVQQLEAQVASYHSESERIFRQILPERRRIPTVSYLKRQLQDEENRLSGGGSSRVSVLPWLAELPELLKTVPNMTIQNIKFDGNRSEVRIQAQSDDFQSFEALRVELAKKFMVEQGQLNKNGDVVYGSYVLTPSAGGQS